MTYPRIRIALAVLFLLTVLISAGLPCLADTPSRPRKLVVIVANRLQFSDIDSSSLPAISKMMRDGAIGLVSPNCFGPKSEASVMLTAQMGASARANGWPRESYDVSEAVPGDQKAGDAYTVRTGRRAPEGSAVFLGLGQALRENFSLGTSDLFGAIGSGFRNAGLRTCAVSNADTPPDYIDRSAAILAADSNGLIDTGCLGASAGPSGGPRGGHGFFSDTARLQETVLECLRQADLVVVSFGDTVRLERYKNGLTDKAYSRHKAAVLRSLDHMLRRLMRAPETDGARFVLASFSPPVDGSWDVLTPIIVYPADTPGLLVSRTTRTQGVVAASDFAPTVLGLAGLPHDGRMSGRAADSVRVPHPRSTVRGIDTRVSVNRALLAPVMWVFAAIAGALFTGSALVVALPLRAPRLAPRLLRPGIVVGVSVPIALLLAVLAPAGASNYIGALAVIAVVVAVVAIAAGALLSPRSGKSPVHALPVAMVFLATAIAVLVDASMGGGLCRFALPSSFYISGLRYYGIGNEYAAILIVMGGLAALLLGRHIRGWLVPALGALTVLALGTGGMGANYGGTVASVVTYGLLWTVVRRGWFGARHVLLWVGAGFAVVYLFSLTDWLFAGEAGTHAGRAAGMAERLGDVAIFPIALRKLLFNLKLTFGGSAWRLYAIFTPLLVLWIYGVQGKVRAAFSDDPRVMSGLGAIWAGLATAFLANDSGIVMVCIGIAMMAAVLLYSVLESRQEAAAEPAAGGPVCRG